MALYVYAITAADHPRQLRDLTGVGTEPVPLRSVAAGPLCAIVSEVEEEIRPKRRDLTAHQEVQDRLMTDGTVLPLQFGYVAPDETALRQVLEERADQYAEALERLEGCAEYHVKASRNEDDLLREILEDSPEARRLNDEIRAGASDPRLPIALGELVAQQVRDRQEELAAELVRALLPLARDHSVHPPTGDDLLSLSLLVERDREEELLAAETKLGQERDDVEFRFAGPLPPYSFVQ